MRWKTTDFSILRKVRFLLGGVGHGFGGEGPQKIVYKLGRVKPVLFSTGEGAQFILARKNLLHVASILYIQAKLPVKINLNYLQVSKNLYIKKLSSPK